jgi:DNA repair exonuclease SbcCD ATPase subunit
MDIQEIEVAAAANESGLLQDNVTYYAYHFGICTEDCNEKVNARFLLDRISLAHLWDRFSTIDSQEDDDQEEAVTQSLIIAQQAAVDELERLEGEQDYPHTDGLSEDEESSPNSGGQLATVLERTSISPNPRNAASRRSTYLNDIPFGSIGDGDFRPQSLESRWTSTHSWRQSSTHSWRQSSTSSRQSVYLVQKWTDQGSEKPGHRDTTSSTPASTEAKRLHELELQLSQSLQSHQELKASYETRERDAEEAYLEKLSQLESDYQSAVHYVKGTEKMLKRMKEELEKYKADNKQIKEEAEEAKAGYVTDELRKFRADYTKIKEEAEEAKAIYEIKGQEAEKNYREKLSRLENDYQSAVYHVKGSEEMLKQVKDELKKYKAENMKMKEQLTGAKERSTISGGKFDMSNSKHDWEDNLGER